MTIFFLNIILREISYWREIRGGLEMWMSFLRQRESGALFFSFTREQQSARFSLSMIARVDPKSWVCLTQGMPCKAYLLYSLNQ